MKGEKIKQLTKNGIEKLMGGINGVVLQVLAKEEKIKKETRFYGCQLSDGFCKKKGCLVVDQGINNGKPFENYMVITISRSMVQPNKEKMPIVIIECYSVVTENVARVIGKPMVYEEYLEKGKNNPLGSIDIFGQPNPPSKINYLELMDDSKDDEIAALGHSSNTRTNSNQQGPRSHLNTVRPPNQSKSNLRLSHQQESAPFRNKSTENSTTNNIKPNNFRNNQNSNASRPKVQQSPPKNKNINNNKLRPGGPIQKVDHKTSPVVRGNQKRHSGQYNSIKDLFVGMENFVLLARVLFVNPTKNFITKKGVDSSLFSIDIGDFSRSTIECTMFGQIAQKFDGKFKEDQVYQIANATVSQNTFMGVSTIRMSITDNSRVSLKEDDNSVPLAQDFCLTVKQLLSAPVGQIVKDTEKIQEFTAKSGKPMRKKMIYLCDPEQKLEAEVTVWNEKCDEIFQKQPIIIKGVSIGEYQSNRQYSLKNNFVARSLKYHSLRKYIKNLQNIEFVNPDSNNKPKRTGINNFNELNNSMEIVGDKGTWSEVVCYVNTIKTSTKPYYLSCPSCKKKVQSQINGQCGSCEKYYEEAIPKYIMQISLCDYFDNIWVSAYDEAAEKITGLSAIQYSKLTEQEIQQLVKTIRFKELKVRLVTNNDEYMNQVRKKTKIIKVVQINYAEEAKSLLAKLEYLIK